MPKIYGKLDSSTQLKTGFYYLATDASHGVLIDDIECEATFAVDPIPMLTSEDFKEAHFTVRNFQPKSIQVIEIKLTKNGRKKWSDILNRISKTKESIVFVCNDFVYLEKQVQVSNQNVAYTFDLLIDPKYQESVLQILKDEITNLNKL